jgi:hypothetical protein
MRPLFGQLWRRIVEAVWSMKMSAGQSDLGKAHLVVPLRPNLFSELRGWGNTQALRRAAQRTKQASVGGWLPRDFLRLAAYW